MPRQCSILNCKSNRRKKSDITFHKFPENPSIRAVWVHVVRRLRAKDWTPTPYSVICSKHFEDDLFDRTGQTCRLKAGAVPTLFESFNNSGMKRIEPTLCDQQDDETQNMMSKKNLVEPVGEDEMDPRQVDSSEMQSSEEPASRVTRGMATRSASEQSNKVMTRPSKRLATNLEGSSSDRKSIKNVKSTNPSTSSQTKPKLNAGPKEQDPKLCQQNTRTVQEASEMAGASQRAKGTKRRKELIKDWSSFDWSMFEDDSELALALRTVEERERSPENYAKRSSKTHADACCQTDLTLLDISKMEEDLVYAGKEMAVLRKKVLEEHFTEEALDESEEEVEFYTGMPTLAMLTTVFNFIAPHITTCSYNKLTAFTEFLIFMLHARFNLSLQAVGSRFAVNVSVAFRTVDGWLVQMHERLGMFVSWPERQLLKETMPLDFTYLFGDRVAVIMDCIEVYVDKHVVSMQSALVAKYNHEDTIKYVIGITPQGAIVYISEPWDGRMSDQEVIKGCNVVDNLHVDDVVVARAGFGFYCAVAELDEDANEKVLVNLEIPQHRLQMKLKSHMDRLVGMLNRKYQIVQSPLYVEYKDRKERIDYITKVIKVCCALTNLSNSGMSCERYEEV